MVIVKAQAGSGKSGAAIRIRQNVLGSGSPDFYLDPLQLQSKDIKGLAGKEMMGGMVDFLFSSFTEMTKRWWFIFTDSNDVKDAYECHVDWQNDTFKKKVYETHLKHNFKILGETTVMDLINLYQNTSAITEISKFLSKNRDDIKKQLIDNATKKQKEMRKENPDLFPTEANIDEEIMKIVSIRRLLNEIKLEDIDKPNVIAQGLGLPVTSGETTEREKEILYTKKDIEVKEGKAKAGDVKRPVGEMIPSGQKFMDAMLYNIGLWDKGETGELWEAGPNYSDFNDIDIVTQYIAADKSSKPISPSVAGVAYAKRKRKENPRIKYNKKTGEASLFIRVELDTGLYFTELMERNHIEYHSDQHRARYQHDYAWDSKDKSGGQKTGLKGTWTKGKTFTFHPTTRLLPPSLFLKGQTKEQWVKKFLDETGNINMEFVKFGGKSITGIEEINLRELLNTNNDLARIIKQEIKPNIHSIISFTVLCTIGYPLPQDKKSNPHYVRSMKDTTFEVQEVRIDRYRRIKLATYGFKAQSQFTTQNRFSKKSKFSVKNAPEDRGGRTARTDPKSYHDYGDPKVASILIPMKRKYKTMKEAIL